MNDIKPGGDYLWSQNIYPGAGRRDWSSGVAFSFRKVNLLESVPTAAPIAHVGMNQVREQFHTVYDSRAGSGEVSVGVHGEDPIIQGSGQIVPTRLLLQMLRLLGRFLHAEAAG